MQGVSKKCVPGTYMGSVSLDLRASLQCRRTENVFAVRIGVILHGVDDCVSSGRCYQVWRNSFKQRQLDVLISVQKVQTATVVSHCGALHKQKCVMCGNRVLNHMRVYVSRCISPEQWQPLLSCNTYRRDDPFGWRAGTCSSQPAPFSSFSASQIH